MSSSTMKIFLVAFLTIASALVVERSSDPMYNYLSKQSGSKHSKPVASEYERQYDEQVASVLAASAKVNEAAAAAPNPADLLAKKFSDIEDTWVQQSKTFFHSYQWGDEYGHTGEGHRSRADFRAQCKEGASKLISIGSIGSVDKYFAPVCQHLQGWHKDLCGKMHGLVVSHMVAGVDDNRRYADTNAHLVCHDMWWHLMTALKAATHRKSWENESLSEGNANADVDRDMQHYRTRVDLEPGTLRGRGYFSSPTL